MNLSIKNVPEDVVERLRGSAKRHHRSMQGEMLTILEEAVRPRVKDLGLGTGDDSTRWIREERDDR